MEPDFLTQILRLVAALGFVLALMGLLAYAIKKLGLGVPAVPNTKNRRLQVIESLPLDARRRAVLLKRDDQVHLVILGASSETVVETAIPIQENHEAP